MQTGVKSFGCENSTAHESPIQSWNLIGPSVVSASKSGAVSPIVSVMCILLVSIGAARGDRSRPCPPRPAGVQRSQTPPKARFFHK